MLELKQVRKAFGRLVAVEDLSFTLSAGEVFGLLGPNGAGKSTTIHMIIGALAPDRGTIRVGDFGPPTLPDVRRQIGLAPQNVALYDDLTARENLYFFGRLYGLSGKHLAQRVDAALGQVGLHERGGGRVGTFSGGMQRRLNLAAAILHEPKLLLLDEPTAGVDPQSRNAIFDFVTQMQAAGCTIVYTTHYMEEAQRLCDRVAIIDGGQLLALDTVDGLLQQYGRTNTVVVENAAGVRRIETEDPRATLTEVLAEPDVLELRIERPNLETVFLNLTGRSLRD
jgi:ABC-2 type transport system ATP-binding protein